MTKVGEGNLPSEEPTINQYHADLNKGAGKFLKALDQFDTATPEEQARLKAVMDEQLLVIRSAVNELKRPGLNKQETKVENDYKSYMQTSSPESYSALKHDIATLRDYNKLD